MTNRTTFAPQLIIPNGVTDVDFYIKAFNAIELRRILNDDGSVHVVELSIDDSVFHLHEETADSHSFSPGRHQGTTVILGLFVPNVDAVMEQAIAAGAEVISPAQDYEYGYRQGDLRDPFGHIWKIEMVI